MKVILYVQPAANYLVALLLITHNCTKLIVIQLELLILIKNKLMSRLKNINKVKKQI